MTHIKKALKDQDKKSLRIEDLKDKLFEAKDKLERHEYLKEEFSSGRLFKMFIGRFFLSLIGLNILFLMLIPNSADIVGPLVFFIAIGVGIGLVAMKKNAVEEKHQDEKMKLTLAVKKLEKELTELKSQYDATEKTTIETHRSALIEEFDKDRNGILDILEGNDELEILINKYQGKIMEAEEKYRQPFLQRFIRLSSKVNTQRANLQYLFDKLVTENNLRNYSQIEKDFKSEIKSYKTVLFNSMYMLTAMVKGDYMAFYKIYEVFDKINVFNSNWQNENLKGLGDINDNLSEMVHSMSEMGHSIMAGFEGLSAVTQDGLEAMSSELKEIDSSVNANTLMTGVVAYQGYKINKKLQA